MTSACRGIRGAITVDANEPAAIIAATRELLEVIVAVNGVRPADIASVIFSATPDLDAEFPARAARDLGWLDVALLCTHEMRVPGALPRCIRVLVHWNTDRPQSAIRHVYLRGARALRPDRSEAPADASDPACGRVAILGLGLIGGSLAGALRASGAAQCIIGFDAAPEPARRAGAAGLVDRAVDDPADAAAEADTVVLAAPVRGILALLDRIEPVLRPGTLVLDVGSTKRRVVERMDRLPAGVRAVGGHPMCGKETAGLEHADPGLFRGAAFALCATARTDADARETAERLVTAIGARPLWMAPDEHDAAVAAVSHLPYLLSVALVRAALDGDAWAERLAASGFRDTSRLAASDVRMMLDILETNADAVVAATDRARAVLTELRDALAARDFDRLSELLSSASRRRGAWASR